MDNEVVSVRIPRRDLEAIDRQVRDGGYVNRSDFVRHAVRAALAEGDEPGIGRLGLAADAHLPNAPARRAPRGMKR